MQTDCYEKGHSPALLPTGQAVCRKCHESLWGVVVNDVTVWHTGAEYARLWKGVDREAVRGMSDE